MVGGKAQRQNLTNVKCNLFLQTQNIYLRVMMSIKTMVLNKDTLFPECANFLFYLYLCPESTEFFTAKAVSVIYIFTFAEFAPNL